MKHLLITTIAVAILAGCSDPEAEANRLFTEASKLIKEGVITGGMIPKLTTCLDTVKKGVDAAVILDGRVAHSILLELFTDQGIGTLISQK